MTVGYRYLVYKTRQTPGPSRSCCAGSMLDDMLAETPDRLSSENNDGNDAITPKAANGTKDAATERAASERWVELQSGVYLPELYVSEQCIFRSAIITLQALWSCWMVNYFSLVHAPAADLRIARRGSGSVRRSSGSPEVLRSQRRAAATGQPVVIASTSTSTRKSVSGSPSYCAWLHRLQALPACAVFSRSATTAALQAMLLDL